MPPLVVGVTEVSVPYEPALVFLYLYFSVTELEPMLENVQLADMSICVFTDEFRPTA